MERRQEERRKALEQEASFVEAKGRFFGVEFSDGRGIKEGAADFYRETLG